MYVTAVVLAAGSGLRFKSKICKPLVEIDSQPIIIYCLKVLSSHPNIDDIVIAVNSQNFKVLLKKIRQYRIDKIKDIVLGGKERQDSVANCLKVLDSRTELILIHDGVRPFIDKGMVSRVITEAKKSGAAILGMPMKATVKLVDHRGIVRKTLNRDELWEVQTPQVFRKKLILGAFEKFGHLPVTDDAMLVEKLGSKVSMVRGSYSNIKITTPEDLIIAGAILKTLK